MNPEIPLDEGCRRHGRTQNLAVQVFYTDHTRISLPDKDALLLLLRLKQIHEERQTLPESDIEKDTHRLDPDDWSDHYE
jgi:hypothetical protein